MIINDCRTCSKKFAVKPYVVRNGFGIYCSRKCASLDKRGPGYTYHTNGYVMLKMPSHPRANKWGFVYEHRIVMEKFIGRILRSDEFVHHRNGDPTDNRLENLQLTTNSDHAREHGFERSRDKGISDPINFKRCRTCKVIKGVDHFSPHGGHHGQLAPNSQCKPCAAAWQRQYRKEKKHG